MLKISEAFLDVAFGPQSPVPPPIDLFSALRFPKTLSDQPQTPSIGSTNHRFMTLGIVGLIWYQQNST